MHGTDVHPGDIVAGKYRIERVLGAGGMGVVAAATHLDLNDLVAIKFLLPAALKNPEVVDRFNREARAAVKIKSEHVARIIDVGKLETGAPYIVMEHLSGGDLDKRLDADIRIPIPEAIDKVLQACEALAEAHALGIVHRDIKPENLFVTRRADGSDCVKVLDFGIAKMSETSVSGANNLTQTQAFLGSPSYMSPEQLASSKDVDARADVWALGVCLFKLIAGSAPFRGDSISALILAVVQSPAANLTELCPDAPPALAEVIAKCLEKQRENRYANVAEMALALAPFGTEACKQSVERIQRVLSGSREATPVPAAGDATSVAEPFPEVPDRVPSMAGTQGAWNLTNAGRKRRVGAKGVALAAGLVAMLGVGAFVLSQTDGAAEQVSGAGDAAPELATSPGPEPAVAEPPPPKVEPDPTPVSAPPPEKITLTIESTPPGAKVYQQPAGLLVGKTPYKVERDASEGQLVFVISKHGYDSQEVTMEADETNKAKVALQNVSPVQKRPARRRPVEKPPEAAKPVLSPSPPPPVRKEPAKPEPGGTVNPFAK